MGALRGDISCRYLKQFFQVVNSTTMRSRPIEYNLFFQSPSIVKRQLPELNNNKPPPLSSTMPPNETPLAKERIHGVQNENKSMYNLY